MRNRVSFSYVDNYSEDYNTYSYTIFLAYSDNDIWRKGIKYTYLEDNVWSYVIHDAGTSYIYQNKNHKVELHESEYDRYTFSLTNNQNDNNKKSISVSNYKNKPIQETLNTEIYCDSNNYSYFPSFIEGFTTERYTSYKVSYGYSTNNMPIDTYNFIATSYGEFIEIGNNLMLNIRGTHDVSNEHRKIVGVGFDETTIPNNMFSGVDYTYLITAYVYEAKSNISNVHDIQEVNDSINIYNNLNISLPGVDNGVNNDLLYEVTHEPDCVKLKIKDTFKHIGKVLLKIELDWNNNKYVLYKDNLLFSGIVDKIGKLDNFRLYVNGNSASKTMLLEGDDIDFIQVSTTPMGADGDITLRTSYTQLNDMEYPLTNSYVGISSKGDHNPNPRVYDLRIGSYSVRELAHQSPVILTSQFTYTNGSKTFSTDISKLFADDITIGYHDVSDNSSTYYGFFEQNKIIYNSNFNIKGHFDISPDYHHQFVRSNSYNKVDVWYTYNNTITRYSNGLSFTSENVNTYNFEFNNLDGEGDYEFYYKLQNGDVSSGNRWLGTITKMNEVYNNDIFLAYEGASLMPLLKGDYAQYMGHIVNVESNYNGMSGLYPDPIVSGFNANHLTNSKDSLNIGLVTTNEISIYDNDCMAVGNIEITFITDEGLHIVTTFSTFGVKKLRSKLNIKETQNNNNIYNGDNLFFGNRDEIMEIIVDKNNNNPYVDLVNYNSNTSISVNETLSINMNNVDDTNNYWTSTFPSVQAILNNFNINVVETENIKFTLQKVSSGTSETINDYSEYITISNPTYSNNSLAFNVTLKTKIKEDLNNDEHFVLSWMSKLNRIGNNEFPEEYWNRIGGLGLEFEYAKKQNSICIYNSTETIDNIPIDDDVYLYTNVKDVNDSSNGPSKYSVQYSTSTSASLETIKIYNGSTEITNNGISGKFSISQGNGVIEFIPNFNNTVGYEETFTLTAKTSSSNIQKTFTLHLIRLSFDFNENISPKYYFEDIYNTNKKLYEEILLPLPQTEDYGSSDSFIKTFCGVSFPSNQCKLYSYKVVNDSDPNIYYIQFKLANASATNLPNGTQFIENNNNLTFSSNENVLIPNSNSNVKVKLKQTCHNTTVSFEKNITISRINPIDSLTKLYTHGQPK